MAALLLGSTVATAGAASSSLAYFTSSDSNGGSWSSGTIVLGVTPATTWTATNILPGDTGSQTITVANTGTGQLRYTMGTQLSKETNGLSSQLSLTIQAGACTSTGATLYSGGLAGGAVAARVLDAGTSEQLCFAWSFNSGAGDTYQGSTVDAAFTFNAEQTKNNP